MQKKVVILGTLDTKGEEHLFLKERIEDLGLKTVVVDTGILEPPFFEPDISRNAVCQVVGHNIGTVAKKEDKANAIRIMAAGASEIVKELYRRSHLDGIISLGGGQGTYIAAQAMRELPFGVPKILVSTIVGGDVKDYVGYKDITLMHSITDILALNSFNKRLFTQAASAIYGMIQVEIHREKESPLVGITMFGNTTPCVMKIKRRFESLDRRHEMLVFHARGTGGKAMEALIRSGDIKGVIDITTTELADELAGGLLSAGAHRLEAAGEMGIPQLIGPGALDMVNFGPPESVPEKYSGRRFSMHTPVVTLMRTNMEENIQLGAIMAQKLNKARGRTLVVVPKKGFSILDDAGKKFFDPECDSAFTRSLKRHLSPEVGVIELDCHLNSDEYAEAVVNQFLQMLDCSNSQKEASK